MTFIPNSIHLLQERTLVAPATDVTFSSLFNRNPNNRMLRLYMTIVNPTVSTSDYYLVIDGHLPFTDYNSNAISASNGGTNFARVNAPMIMDNVLATPNGIFYGYTDIIYDEHFTLYRWISINVKGVDFPIAFINWAGTLNVGIAPIDSITVHSTIVNAIATGSKFKLFRVSTI